MLITCACSVRVSNELGAGHPRATSFSVIVVNLSSLLLSVILAVIVLSLRHVISYAFTSGIVVADAVSELSPFLAASIVLGGVQPVLSGKFHDFILLQRHRDIIHSFNQSILKAWTSSAVLVLRSAPLTICFLSSLVVSRAKSPS